MPRSLEGSLFGVVPAAGEQVVGMGRVVCDGALFFYIRDFAVDSDWHGCGISQQVVEALLGYIERVSLGPVFVGLFATRDAMPLYERNGSTEGDLTGMFRLVHPDHGVGEL